MTGPSSISLAPLAKYSNSIFVPIIFLAMECLASICVYALCLTSIYPTYCPKLQAAPVPVYPAYPTSPGVEPASTVGYVFEQSAGAWVEDQLRYEVRPPEGPFVTAPNNIASDQ